MSAATYLYCIVKATRRPSDKGLPPGIPETSPPQLLDLGRGLWAVVGEVPLDTYGPGRLEERLQDLDWVGQVALAHELVVEHFTTRPRHTVIPMTLFTMFSGPARVRAETASRRTAVARVMERIKGTEEWGVRILRGEGTSLSVPAGQPPPASGAAFLAARKQARDDARSTRMAAADAVAGAYAQLARIARDAVRRQDLPASGATPPLLDAAFLVPIRTRARFNRAAREQALACAKAGVQLTITGPWPPYNFVGTVRKS